MSERISWLRRFLSSYRRPVVLALALGLVTSAFSALLMFTSGFLISATAQAGVTLFSIMLPIAFVQIFGIGRPFARYVERLVSHSWVLKVTSDLRRTLYRHIARFALDPAESRASGEYLSLLADDIDHLQNLYLRVVFPAAVAILTAVCATIVFGLFSPAYALIMLVVFAGTVIGLPMASLAASRMRSMRAKDLRTVEYTSLTDDILGRDDWILSGRSNEMLHKHARTDSELKRLESSIRMTDRGLELLSSLILGLAVCATLVWSAGAFGGEAATANWIAAFTLGFFPLIESFAVLPATVSTANEHLQSVDHLKSLDGREEKLAERESLPIPKGPVSLSLEHVTYRYPQSSQAALDDMSVRIPAGQHIAILGRSGAGKSTCAAIMRGLLEPADGAVLVGGVEISGRQYGISNAVGYLSQNPYLFNKTLRDNLLFANPEATDEDLIELLNRVGLGTAFESLPNGLDTVIGETGTGFSGGEAHRIALARVLAADVGAIIVDEPFAALDPATEAALLETLLSTCEHRTLVVITHHLALIEQFDRVVFLEDGRISLDGTPAELMEQNGYFRNLVQFDRG